MDKNKHVFGIVLEVMQWLLIAAVLTLYFLVCSRVTEHLKSEQDMMLYQQIDNSRRIENLNEEKMLLADSISNIKKDTIYITRWSTPPCE